MNILCRIFGHKWFFGGLDNECKRCKKEWKFDEQNLAQFDEEAMKKLGGIAAHIRNGIDHE